MFSEFVSDQDSSSEGSALVKVQLLIKTPMPGGQQYFARSFDVNKPDSQESQEFKPKTIFKVAQTVSEKQKNNPDQDNRLRAMEVAMAQFLREHPAEKPVVRDNPERMKSGD